MYWKTQGLPAQVPTQPLRNFISDVGPEPLPYPGHLPSNATGRRNVRGALAALRAQGVDGLTTPVVIDLHAGTSRGHFMQGCCPCLTRSHTAARGFWLSWKQRPILLTEALALQGLWPGRIPLNVVSDQQLGAIAGNAIPVPLLARVLAALLTAAGLLSNSDSLT